MPKKVYSEPGKSRWPIQLWFQKSRHWDLKATGGLLLKYGIAPGPARLAAQAQQDTAQDAGKESGWSKNKEEVIDKDNDTDINIDLTSAFGSSLIKSKSSKMYSPKMTPTKNEKTPTKDVV